MAKKKKDSKKVEKIDLEAVKLETEKLEAQAEESGKKLSKGKKKKIAKKAKKNVKREAKLAEYEANPAKLENNKTLFKCVTAVVCVIAICISLVTNIDKVCEAMKKAASPNNTSASDGANDAFGDDSAAGVDGEIPTDAAGEVPTDANGAEVPTSADANNASGAGNAASSGSSASAGKTNSGSASSGSSIPTGVSQIVSYYNTATAKVVSKKAPFNKTRSTTEKSYDAGLALKTFKGTVYKFMGVGNDNKFTKTVTSGDADSYHKYFKASKLTANDVTSATCTKSGSNYTITLHIKNGSSSVAGGKVVSSNNAPLDRSGLACGDHDKDYWDHKTAENVMSAISQVPGCGSADVKENYSNAVITAVVNASTGNLVSLSAKFDFKFELSGVMGSSATANASSVVNMTGFKM